MYHSGCFNPSANAPGDLVNWLCTIIFFIREVFHSADDDEEFVQNEFIRTDETATTGLYDCTSIRVIIVRVFDKANTLSDTGGI